MQEITRKIELLNQELHALNPTNEYDQENLEMAIEFLEAFNPYKTRSPQSLKSLITEFETHDLLCLDLKNTLINLILRYGNMNQAQALYHHLNADTDSFEFADDYEFKTVVQELRHK